MSERVYDSSEWWKYFGRDLKIVLIELTNVFNLESFENLNRKF